MRTLVDFSDPTELARWSSINDAVMGGRSRSAMDRAPEGHAVFSGSVSFENGGGFASVRRHPEDLGRPEATAFVLEVLGDGRRYKFNLRTDDGFDGINYQCGFHPSAGIWTTCCLDRSEFVPTWRGRPVPGSVPLDPSRVRQLGLLIADRQEGHFRLAIRSITIAQATA